MLVMLHGNPGNPPRPHKEGKLCWSSDEWTVKLYQRGVDRFTVQYGLQTDQELSYGEACAKLGQAILHALACDGELDNRERGQRR